MNMLALTIILPLIGFVLLAFSRGRWSEISPRLLAWAPLVWRRW